MSLEEMEQFYNSKWSDAEGMRERAGALNLRNMEEVAALATSWAMRAAVLMVDANNRRIEERLREIGVLPPAE
jgi:hypothetical protein